LNLSLENTARLGLLGVNGAGKSTFIKTLAADRDLLSGERIEGKGLKIGYFAQHQVDELRLDESPLWHMQKLDPKTREQELRNYLGGFDFRGDMASTPVGPFSGGEKARLALALLIWQKPNLLLLDEPTNHLDIEMRQALTLALQDFEGAIIVVSHDRHLLRATVDNFWLIENGTVRPFDGDLDDYTRYSQEVRAAQQAGANEAAAPASNEPKIDRKAQKRAEAEARQRLANQRKPVEQKLAKLEKQLATLNAENDELTVKLGAEDLYEAANKDKLQAALLRKADIKAQIDEIELTWLDLTAQLDEMMAE